MSSWNMRGFQTDAFIEAGDTSGTTVKAKAGMDVAKISYDSNKADAKRNELNTNFPVEVSFVCNKDIHFFVQATFPSISNEIGDYKELS